MSRYIDADALGIGKADPNVFEKPEYAEGWNSAIDIINNAPTADVQEVRHGHWIKMKNFCLIPTYECSLCGRQIQTIGNARKNAPYCHCGAKMDEEEV